MTKFENYKELVYSENLEFIIAIVTDIKNGLRPIDLFELLYGPYIDDRIKHSFHSETSGLYYQSDYKEYLSGVLFLNRSEQRPLFYKNYHLKNSLLSKLIENKLSINK